MCGINGIISKNTSSTVLEEEIQTMNDSIVHRGPDDDGVFIKEHGNHAIGMGMRRLSIIDLSTGKQPISSDEGNLTIVFNGEIYNYQKLRAKLCNEGVLFKTQSDTEVILKLYEKYGPNALKQLDGMFAFSIYDQKRG